MAAETIVLKGRSRRAIERIGHFGPTKIRLDKDTDEIVRKIARAYGRAWQVTRGEVRTMADYAADQMHNGDGLSAREVAKLDRVDRAMHALERQVRDLDKFTGVQILGGANRAYRNDVDQVLNALADLTGLDRRFTKPSGAAMEALILRSAQQITSATQRLDATQGQALKDGLFRGLIHGEYPPETARAIVAETEGAFFGGLNRATTIARTEILDAHRSATKLAYNESELVTGWKWLATLDTKTCPACWAMHNTKHDKTESQWAHQNCRCTTVPILADDDPTDHDLGDPEEIFWGLSREDQLAIMGPGRLKALEAGVAWSDLTYLKHNPTWRPSQQVTRVSDLTGLAELNTATYPGDVIEIPGFTNSSVMSYAYAQGGLTVHALTGDQPTTGFVVARQGTSEVIEAREFFGPKGPTTMAAWMRRHGDRLDEPGAHVGMWYDTANGKVVLDVVEIVKDRDAAIALGRAEDQIAIFDLDTFAEIQTGGTGGYATNLTADLGKADIGREAVITRGEEDIYGKVVAAGSWGIRVQTGDGEYVNAAPGQFFFESAAVQSRVDEINQVHEIMARAEHGIKVDYSGASPKSAQELDDALEDLTEDWQGVRPTRVEVRPNANGAYATTHTPAAGPINSWIEVDESSAGDYDAWRESMRRAEERGHFHTGASDEPAEYCIDHEFGHVLDFKVLGRQGSDQRAGLLAEVYNDLMATAIERGETTTAKPQEMAFRWADPAFQNLLTEDLSYYATKSQHEMIAEAFAVYRDHGRGESVVADTVMGTLVNAFIKQFGVAPEEDDIAALIEEVLA